jgi:hypothetical protein
MLGEFNVITIYGGHERLGECVRVLLLICTGHGEMSERGSKCEREREMGHREERGDYYLGHEGGGRKMARWFSLRPRPA